MLEHLTERKGLDERTAICFAYYNYRITDLQGPQQIAAALLKQLCRRSDAVSPWLLKSKHDSLSPLTVGTEQSIIKLVAEMKFREVFIVIDALDECVTDLPKLLDFIAQKSSVSPRVKWIVSSRN